jgi:hypothetical protein
MEKLVALLGRHCRRRIAGAPTGARPAPLQVAGHAPAPATRDGGCRCRGIDTCIEIVTLQYVPSTEVQPAIAISNPARAGSAGPQFELRLAAADIEDSSMSIYEFELRYRRFFDIRYFDIEVQTFDIDVSSFLGASISKHT